MSAVTTNVHSNYVSWIRRLRHDMKFNRIFLKPHDIVHYHAGHYPRRILFPWKGSSDLLSDAHTSRKRPTAGAVGNDRSSAHVQQERDSDADCVDYNMQRKLICVLPYVAAIEVAGHIRNCNPLAMANNAYVSTPLWNRCFVTDTPLVVNLPFRHTLLWISTYNGFTKKTEYGRFAYSASTNRWCAVVLSLKWLIAVSEGDHNVMALRWKKSRANQAEKKERGSPEKTGLFLWVHLGSLLSARRLVPVKGISVGAETRHGALLPKIPKVQKSYSFSYDEKSLFHKVIWKFKGTSG
ncbi:hypothetical protein TNCV_159131 [Trichonephila clavipes]|uniref:Uncharacterized protein n=1 Tax=Trichonephila clavipes TaxID=2585209 RepID=A0A8X6UXV8_TRICX|nr:hypothetical protein TNCV_159131 [Trichonephila clavipes]